MEKNFTSQLDYEGELNPAQLEQYQSREDPCWSLQELDLARRALLSTGLRGSWSKAWSRRQYCCSPLPGKLQKKCCPARRGSWTAESLRFRRHVSLHGQFAVAQVRGALGLRVVVFNHGSGDTIEAVDHVRATLDPPSVTSRASREPGRSPRLSAGP